MGAVKKPAITLLRIFAFMCAMQFVRFGIKNLCFVFWVRDQLHDRVASMLAMGVLSVLIILITRKRGIRLSVFPERFSIFYLIGTCIFLAVWIATPILTHSWGWKEWLVLVYSTIAVPVFEELIFRGLVWNALVAQFKKDWIAYLLSTLLFAIWHLGYIDSIRLRIQTGLANAMLWKGITGLCFGTVIGALRLKTKNCFSTMLFHGLMNLLGR